MAGIGLPRFSEGYQENKRIGWEEIKYSQTGSFSSEIIYNANSKGPEKLKFCFEAPFKKFERKKNLIHNKVKN